MRNFVTILFDSAPRAFDGQHALWELDSDGSVTVHGSAVCHRDKFGQFIVDTDDSVPPGVATALGAGLGALLGALAGPAGLAGAAAVSAGTGAAIGAGIGGTGGFIGDVAHADVNEQAGYETGFVLGRGQYAVIADVTENWTTPIDTRMKRLGGSVFRRARSTIRDDAMEYPYSWDSYLYPYEYRPNLDTVG
jgi:uncharacterized membrane protein